MIRSPIVVLAAFSLLSYAEQSFAFVVVHRVTAESQAKQGFEFALSADSKNGFATVELTVPRKGRFATLSLVYLHVKDADGKELMYVPLATTEDKGGSRAQFRLATQQAARCTIVLETEVQKLPERDFAVNYLIDVESYLEPQPIKDPVGVQPLEGIPEIGKGPSSPPKDGWAKLKGQVVWQGKVPQQQPQDEDYIIDNKTNGLKNVFVWLRPIGAKRADPFPQKSIHPDLLKPPSTAVTIDQPNGRFIPHVLAAREGQSLIFKNSAQIAHNPQWSSAKNGDINPLLPAGGEFKLKNPLVFEPGEIQLRCTIHNKMKAHIRVFDHPYFAITDAEGKFEINDAPLGNYTMFIHHPATGWLNGAGGRNGTPIVIKAGEQNLGVFKMKSSE